MTEEPLLRLVPEDYARTRDHHEFGGGFSLQHSTEGYDVGWRYLDPQRHGACVARVGDTQQHTDVMQLAAFAPGEPVQLRLEPDGPDGAEAIGVWDEAGTVRVGTIARQNHFDVRAVLFGDAPVQALVLWDWRTEDGRRTGLNLLVARVGVVAGLDIPSRRYERPSTRRTVNAAPVIALAALVWLVLAVLFGAVGALVGLAIVVLAIAGTRDRS
jgi:hypothetical protein